MESKSQKLTEMILDTLKKFEYLNRKDTVICHPKWYDQVKEILSDNGLEDRCDVRKDYCCDEDKFFIVDSKEADKIKFVREQPEEIVKVKINKTKIGYWTL